MVMVMFSALVRSHQSTSRVASAPCLARRKTTLTQQSIELLKQRPCSWPDDFNAPAHHVPTCWTRLATAAC